mmetsp:Transcript_10132/g.33771  ORF Transcript_10132/g.33771 Transcript_10132/m.33771 type:complete len:131 (+) Transcript_10132:38-430(+)
MGGGGASPQPTREGRRAGDAEQVRQGSSLSKVTHMREKGSERHGLLICGTAGVTKQEDAKESQEDRTELRESAKLCSTTKSPQVVRYLPGKNSLILLLLPSHSAYLSFLPLEVSLPFSSSSKSCPAPLFS